jgi:hypothetical protein
MIDWIGQYDRRLFIVVAAMTLAVVITGYGLFRMGAYLTYKSIEGHIEKKITMMVTAEALVK